MGSLIYFDTSIYLDFYQSGTDRVAIFDTIIDLGKAAVVTDQTVREFRRNRDTLLLRTIDEVKSAGTPRSYSVSLLDDLAEFKDIKSARESLSKATEHLVARLSTMLESPESDPVYSKFADLCRVATLLDKSANAISRAKTRKLLGDPPTSPGKQTIGDELIWETLLESSKDDLVFVTRDKTYFEHRSILADEYLERTGAKLLKFTKDANDGLRAAGRTPAHLLLTHMSEDARDYSASDGVGRLEQIERICGFTKHVIPGMGAWFEARRARDFVRRARAIESDADILKALDDYAARLELYPDPFALAVAASLEPY